MKPVQITVSARDLVHAEKVLTRIEKEIEADWRYHDFPREALDDIKALAGALRKLLGPEEPKTETKE